MDQDRLRDLWIELQWGVTPSGGKTPRGGEVQKCKDTMFIEVHKNKHLIS